MYMWRNNEARSRNYYCSGKAISNTYSQYVYVAVVIQNAKRMRRALLSSVSCLTLLYFAALSYKEYDFRKNGYGI
jgi:hypothetical protein